MTCSIPLIADFLLYLFREKELAAGTIANYKAAISSTRTQCGDSSLVHDASLHDLLRSFHIQRHRPINVIPPWNLALVLDALRKPPFEPLISINLPNLTVKTVFLVALATGRRRSELHAMTMERSGLAYDGKSFMLNMDRNFLGKSPNDFTDAIQNAW